MRLPLDLAIVICVLVNDQKAPNRYDYPQYQPRQLQHEPLRRSARSAAHIDSECLTASARPQFTAQALRLLPVARTALFLSTRARRSIASYFFFYFSSCVQVFKTGTCCLERNKHSACYVLPDPVLIPHHTICGGPSSSRYRRQCRPYHTRQPAYVQCPGC